MSRLLLALPFAAAVGCGSATADQATTAGAPMAVPQAPGVRVETAEVSRSDARLTLSLPGEVVGVLGVREVDAEAEAAPVVLQPSLEAPVHLGLRDDVVAWLKREEHRRRSRDT